MKLYECRSSCHHKNQNPDNTFVTLSNGVKKCQPCNYDYQALKTKSNGPQECVDICSATEPYMVHRDQNVAYCITCDYYSSENRLEVNNTNVVCATNVASYVVFSYGDHQYKISVSCASQGKYRPSVDADALECIDSCPGELKTFMENQTDRYCVAC